MTALHTEVNLEAEIVRELCSRGWIEGKAGGYDKNLALFREDAVGWLQDTQPDEYAKVKKVNNGSSDQLLLERLAKTIDEEGTIAVLRRGFKRTPARFDMCAFKPSSGLNPQNAERYGKVRCRVVRQVRYSRDNEKCIDLVLFVNGIAVATIELKTEMTQSVQDAIDQYKRDRAPKDPKTNRGEPLLTPKRGAIVHFAVSDEEVWMTTALAGKKTAFLPFNLGYDDGAGNPPNPTGAKAAYLWERILERETWLDILDRFVHVEKREDEVGGKKVRSERIIFPRYHQWDVVTQLVAKSKEERDGHKYLVQHSAGSGKSNSIMWLAHRLSTLHDDQDAKIFDSVIVVTDRSVLDRQLQDNIFQYEHKSGVVKRITKEGSKSGALEKALDERTPIVIVTIQTFPALMDRIGGDRKRYADRTFAIIADEAHSSQTGKTAGKLKSLLGSAEGEPEGEDGEDIVATEAARRARAKNISYFAFTATPKPRTMELFGSQDPVTGEFNPFHVYSMQQAIEEGFILDVLQNYTTYDFIYKLITDPQFEKISVPKSKTAKLLASRVKQHATNVAQRVDIIVEHFRENVRHLLGGRAKAMVVTDSRKMAAKYKLAMDEYIAKRGYSDVHTLVAFTAEVEDETFPGKKVSESSLNGFPGSEIAERFKKDEYNVLLVAEKFQTGFDQPLLCAMYVDKKLADINAVQTLSRLNRTYERDGHKKTAENVFVLDFVNDPDEILVAFRKYYKKAQLAEATDPDQIHSLQSKLDSAGMYGQNDVGAYATAYFESVAAGKDARKHTPLKAALDPTADRWKRWIGEAKAHKDETEIARAHIFRHDMAQFARAYAFLSQIYDYADSDLEKHALFYEGLVRLLHDTDDDAAIDLSGVVPTLIKNRLRGKVSLILKDGEGDQLKPGKFVGTATVHATEYAPLSEVIEILNMLNSPNSQQGDAELFAVTIERTLAKDKNLALQAVNNDVEQFEKASDFGRVFDESVMDARDEIERENDRQKTAVVKMLDALFSDKESFEKLRSLYAKRMHDLFNTETPPAA
ncbi:MAG: type I restriction endonuclease subunit R [Vulcanimicrobiaceae bacterium]